MALEKQSLFFKKLVIVEVRYQTVLITGAGGLVGGNIAEHYLKLGLRVIGIDDDSRRRFFGESAGTSWRISQLEENFRNFTNFKTNIADKSALFEICSQVEPHLVVHAAAQPSHDFAAKNVYTDFEANAIGTLNMLEASRKFFPEVNFIHFSTNKVYGDSVNSIPFVEKDLRFEYSNEKLGVGIDENQSIDQSRHSLFGVSKVFADLAVQEYGLNFGMRTTVLRGGCLTGPHHSSSEAHGFLSYLVRSAVNNVPYKIIGYLGKQVRDNIHTDDVICLIDKILEKPNYGDVFNLGGGFSNSISILEMIDLLKKNFGLNVNSSYVETERFGDHRIYYTSNQKLVNRYPKWQVRKSIFDIVEDLIKEWENRK
jgi:CDP-paratose 2-epimerase